MTETAEIEWTAAVAVVVSSASARQHQQPAGLPAWHVDPFAFAFAPYHPFVRQGAVVQCQ